MKRGLFDSMPHRYRRDRTDEQSANCDREMGKLLNRGTRGCISAEPQEEREDPATEMRTAARRR